MKLPSSSTYAFWLALFRIYAGAFWLMHGIPKFTQSQDFMPPNGAMTQFSTDRSSITVVRTRRFSCTWFYRTRDSSRSSCVG